MAATAKTIPEIRTAPIADVPERRPALALVQTVAPRLRLRCRWEYRAEEGRIVQIWEMRP